MVSVETIAKEDRTMAIAFDKIKERFTNEERTRIDRDASEIVAQNRSIAELRKALNLSQDDVAKALKTTQSNVAQIEHKKDVMVSTVVRMVEALGGKLELRAVLPGREPVPLRLGAKAKKGRDRTRVSGEQGYEVRYFAK